MRPTLFGTVAGGGAVTPIALVAHTAGGGTADVAPFTTSAIDTTGASLLVVCSAYYNVAAPTVTVTDSKGNSWQALTRYPVGNGAAPLFTSRIWYCKNPTVGAGHTFTSTGDGNAVYMALAVMAFNNTDITADVDQSNGGSGITSPRASGSITPSFADTVVVSMAATAASGSAPTVDSDFNVVDAVTGAGVTDITSAYLVQTAAAAVNATWSYGSPNNGFSAAIANFKHE